jgi:alkylated DNA repair dioxygenase AlkB
MKTGVRTPQTSSISPERWQPFVIDDDLGCYSYYLPHSSTNDSVISSSRLDEWFAALHPNNFSDEPTGFAWTDASYKNRKLSRKTAWCANLNTDDDSGDERCICEYGYSDTWQPLIRSSKMLTVLRDITSVITTIVGGSGAEGHDGFNSCNLNYYPKGGGVGYHADDEFLFDGLNRSIRIVSLSLCARNQDVGGHDGERLFQVKRKRRNVETTGNGEVQCEEENTISEITLKHGDIITMEGMFQKFYLHSVWPGDDIENVHTEDDRCQGERINLTWRTIVRHLDGSDECRGLICPMSKK